jgi:CheY-like chemotaxis protein
VLVVDDVAADRDLHGMLLRADGLRTVDAADGWEALVCARTLLPDLVIADVRMPGLDGWALLARLRAAAATARIPVLIVTGGLHQVDTFTRLGSRVALLGKPLSRDALRAAVAALLGA